MASRWLRDRLGSQMASDIGICMLFLERSSTVRHGAVRVTRVSLWTDVENSRVTVTC